MYNYNTVPAEFGSFLSEVKVEETYLFKWIEQK